MTGDPAGNDAFRAWALPEGLEWSGRTAELRCEPGGGRIVHPRLEAGEARALARGLRTSAEGELASRDAGGVARTLGRVGRRFLDPDDPLAAEARKRLPGIAGISAPMAREVVRGMARDWTPERLLALLRADLGDPGVLDRFVEGPAGGRIRAVGPRLGFHVSAGTVPGVSVTSLIRGLLVKSPVLLKPGRGDVVLPVLFARGLREEDPGLADALAVAYWPGGTEEVEGAILAEADTVVVHGGNDTVRSLRERMPVTARLVAYRHRLSAGLVGRDALEGDGARRTAEAAARAVAVFDQRGCVSPHAFYVERGGTSTPEGWAEALAEALDALEAELPSGPLLPGEASEVQQLRGSGELEAAADPARAVRHGGAEAPWTVLVEPDPAFAASCLGRVVRIHPVDDLDEAVDALARVRPHLQSVALACAPERRTALAEALARAGALRVTSLESLPWPPAWWHHDGRGPLRALVRWIDLEE